MYLSKQMSKSGFFLSRSHIGRDSGFGIVKQNRENPDEIGMVGHSELVKEIQTDKNHPRGEGYASVFLFNVQVFVRSFATITIYMLC